MSGKIKRALKNPLGALQRKIFPDRTDYTGEEEMEVVVAGIPRSGTTWMFRSLAGLRHGDLTPPRDVYDKLPLMKCHSLAPPETFGDRSSDELAAHAEAGGSCIFMFGDVVESVISTRLKRWDENHAANCGYTGSLESVDMYDADVLNYGRMFETWMKGHDYPVLALRYETVGDHLAEVEKFLGRDVKWNEFRARRKPNRDKVGADEVGRIESAYSELIEKVAAAPDISHF